MQPKMKRGIRFAKRTIASTKLSKRIGWLNKNVELTAEVQYSEVKDLLTQVGDAGAMRILAELEGKGIAVRDPTAYVKAAAIRELEGDTSRGRRRRPLSAKEQEAAAEGSEGGESSRAGAGGALLRRRVEKRVQWLNTNANLTQDLLMEEVGDALVSAGHRQAMTILKNLEESAKEVLDPNTYVLSELSIRDGGAAGNGDGGGGGGVTGGGEGKVGRGSGRRRRGKGALLSGPPGRHVIKKTLKDQSEPERQFADQVRRRLDWLNSHGGLAQQLDFARVGDLLIRTGQRTEVMKILKVLEENAAEVRDPNAYVARAAKRLVKDQAPLSDADTKLRKRIGWLNKRVQLQVPIDYDRVAPFLSDLDIPQAMEILRRLEESATEVRDPSAYIIAAARRLLDEQQPQAVYPQPQPPLQPLPQQLTHQRPELLADAKLRKRITWLNSHVALSTPLNYERVAPELLSIDLLGALEVLNNLEENVESVRDPNAYVVAGARRLAGQQRGGGLAGGLPLPGLAPERTRPRGERPGGAPPPVGKPGLEEKLIRRLTWLNKNVCPAAPLDFDQVVPVLLPLQLAQAMEILKKFEEAAHEVRNPTAYVASAARRLVGSAGGSASSGRLGAIGSGPRPSRAPSTGGGGGAAASRTMTPIGLAGASPRTGVAGGRPGPMMALPGTAAMDDKITYYGGAEEKLRKRINWLNENVPLTFPLAPERVVPELLKVEPRQAMEMLKRLEEGCHEVRDPNGYVISLARRRFSGEGGGGGAPARRRRRSAGDDDGPVMLV